MYRKFFLAIFIVIFFRGAADSQQISPEKIVPGKWIKSWMLCGPIPLERPNDQKISDYVLEPTEHLIGFNSDYLNKAGGEKNFHIKAGDIVKFTNGSAKWKLFNSPDSIIDLQKAVPGKFPALAYAYTEIQAEETREYIISLGTNDGGSLWINGLNVWEYRMPRWRLSVDDELIPVRLNKGINTILLKIEERYNRGGFCARFLPFSMNKLSERGDLLTITTDLAGEAIVSSMFVAPVLQQLIKTLEIDIFNHRRQTVVKEQRSSGFCGKISLKTDEFQPYNATARINLLNGETINQKISFFAGKRINYTLFSNGKSDYRIALCAGASESERWAAGELQHWMKEISGVEIPVQALELPYRGHQIIIGYNDLVREKTGDNVPADLEESFRYCNSGADILIYGGNLRGTMYGVMAFLENEFGCRWYTPAVSIVPAKGEFIFNWLDRSEKPGIRVRNDFYFEAFDPVWAARNRMNGTLGFTEVRQQPGGMESYWAVHTFFPLVPPDEFYTKHPEYYSLIEGKRIHKQAQLCLTNPDVLKIITERIKKRMRESPEYLIYDVSQNDCFNPCQCDKCQAIVYREGGESGLIIWFVNQVAESVEKEFPDKFIGTLAFQYTRTPPKHIHPRNNVVVRLCSIECCFAHDFKSCPENKSFLADLKGWSALAPHLYIWDYVVDFVHYILPYPNFKVLQSNIQIFRENNSIGIMEQGAFQCRGGEFSELRAYLISRLLWNPDCDAEKVIGDFIYGYYGRADKFVRQYFELLQGLITPATHIHMNITPENRIYSDQFIKDSYEIFEQARKVADNENVLKRVELASLPVLYLKCWRTPVLAKFDGTYARFCAIAKREGVAFYSGAGEVQRISFHTMVEEAK